MLTLAVNVAAIAFFAGKLRGGVTAEFTSLRKSVDEIKTELQASGDSALIRRAELTVLKEKVDEAREDMKGEIVALRDVSIAHSKLLSEHEIRLTTLESSQD
jgi:hypothetical protein